MRLKISHTTSYTFDPPPSGLIQVLRLTPGNHDGQYVADWHVDVSVDTRLDMQHDAFGNITHVFSHGSLAELTVHVSGMVETQDTGGVMRERLNGSLPASSCAAHSSRKPTTPWQGWHGGCAMKPEAASSISCTR
jgi:transglutaminase-like putative cysteine protease